jgi:transcriptional regulator with XRE-family HTH domain/DNA-binding NarL/FixJ family response regulator
MPERTKTIKGDLVQRLRIAKGWSQKRLAKAALCSLRTITDIESNGGERFLGTILRIADALQVGYEQLIVGDPPPPLPEGYVSGFGIKIAGEPESLVEGQSLIAQIRNLLAKLESEREIDVPDIGKGSVVVNLTIHWQDAVRLLLLEKSGQLAEIGIKEVVATQEAIAEVTSRFSTATGEGASASSSGLEGATRQLSQNSPTVPTASAFHKSLGEEALLTVEIARLSDKEKTVLTGYLENRPVYEIAEEMGLSSRTVERYLSHLREKLRLEHDRSRQDTSSSPPGNDTRGALIRAILDAESEVNARKALIRGILDEEAEDNAENN